MKNFTTQITHEGVKYTCKFRTVEAVKDCYLVDVLWDDNLAELEIGRDEENPTRWRIISAEYYPELRVLEDILHKRIVKYESLQTLA